MNAQGGVSGSGIGGGRYQGATISISENAQVTATGGNNGAGIGSGWAGKAVITTISGNAHVVATGGINSAGIGGGVHGSNESTIISGGTVIANGGTMGSGIGSGSGVNTSAGTIKITDRFVTAIGGNQDTSSSLGRGRVSVLEELQAVRKTILLQELWKSLATLSVQMVVL